MGFEEVFALVSDGVAQIEAATCTGGSTGSSALVAPDLLVTAAHVVDGYSTLRIVLGEQVTSGEVIGFAPENDVALVRTEAPLEGHVFEISDDAAPVAQEIAAVGYPLNGPLSIAGPGIVSANDVDISLEADDGSIWHVGDVMRMTVPINPGNSGGPVVDRSGAIVGLVSAAAAQTAEEVDGEIELTIVDGFKYAIAGPTVGSWVERWRSVPETHPAAMCEEEFEPALDLVHALTEGPETDVVTGVLFDYFDGINSADYERAYARVGAGTREGLSLEQFAEQQSTSVVFDVLVLDVLAEAGGIRAGTAFTSLQDPEFGPEGQTCTIWTLDYRFVEDENGWTIAGADEVPGVPQYQPCS